MMAISYITEYLSLIKFYIPVELIDEEQWAKFELVGKCLPSAVTTFFGFECRLGVPEAKADFLICADASEAGRRVLAANAYDIDLSKELLQHPVWMNIRRFCTNWESEASPLYDKVRNVWLEFDVADEAPELPIPSCFFGPEYLYAAPAVEERHPHNWVWQIALPLLSGRDFPASVERNLMLCFEALPQNAYIFQIGLMLARQWDGVRLCVRDIIPSEIVPYLTRLGWEGALETLQKLVSDLSQFAERIDLNIDVTDKILPKIGLECYLLRQPQVDENWNLFLDDLVAKGLCLPHKKEALLNYPGYIRRKMSPLLWPSNLQKLSTLLDPTHEWVIFKGLHHIKLVYQDAHVQEAKAYLYVSRSLVKG
jgi:hypothetical protein